MVLAMELRPQLRNVWFHFGWQCVSLGNFSFFAELATKVAPLCLFSSPPRSLCASEEALLLHMQTWDLYNMNLQSFTSCTFLECWNQLQAAWICHTIAIEGQWQLFSLDVHYSMGIRKVGRRCMGSKQFHCTSRRGIMPAMVRLQRCVS